MVFVPLDQRREVVHIVGGGHGGVVVTQEASFRFQATEVCLRCVMYADEHKSPSVVVQASRSGSRSIETVNSLCQAECFQGGGWTILSPGN
jgi:hypothetical protein